jgi:hypothetical protein
MKTAISACYYAQHVAGDLNLLMTMTICITSASIRLSPMADGQ